VFKLADVGMNTYCRLKIDAPFPRNPREYQHILSYISRNYTVSQKNCANLFFAPCLSNMNRFQWQLEGLSQKKPLTKLCLNYPLHLKYVLVLPWEIWSVRLSRQRN